MTGPFLKKTATASYHPEETRRFLRRLKIGVESEPVGLLGFVCVSFCLFVISAFSTFCRMTTSLPQQPSRDLVANLTQSLTP